MNDDLKCSLFCKKVHVASGDLKLAKWEKLSNCNESITAFWCGRGDGHGTVERLFRDELQMLPNLNPMEEYGELYLYYKIAMKHHALWRLRGQEVEGQIATRGALIEKLEKDTPRKISITRQASYCRQIMRSIIGENQVSLY